MTVTPHQRQRWSRTEPGIARFGECATIFAADKSQRCNLGRGFTTPVLFQNSHRPGLLPSRRRVSPLAILLPASCGARQTFPRYRACKPFARNSFPAKQGLQTLAHRVTHQRRLSKPSSSAGSTNASKRGQGLGNFIRDRGTIIQGQGRHD